MRDSTAFLSVTSMLVVWGSLVLNAKSTTHFAFTYSSLCLDSQSLNRVHTQTLGDHPRDDKVNFSRGDGKIYRQGMYVVTTCSYEHRTSGTPWRRYVPSDLLFVPESPLKNSIKHCPFWAEYIMGG